jgi:tetratricopeptide (TPR) repeat protein
MLRQSSTKSNEKTLAEIEARLKNFGGDMIKIEYLENCLKQLGLPNDAKRFCHLQLANSYAYKLMWGLAAKNMDGAAECATTYKEKVDYYLKEIAYLIKIGDYLMIDKAFKKALLCANNNQEKEFIKSKLKADMNAMAQEYEKKNKRSSAASVYERLMDMPITTDTERKQLMEKLAKLNSGLGRIREATRYEQMMKRPTEPKKSMDPDENARRISFEDLGIDRAY